MNSATDITHVLKNTFLSIFPEAIPGSNGNIKLFSSFEEEYRALNKGVGVRSLAGEAVLKLIGNEVLDFLHRISTNDVKNLGVYKLQRTLFTNEKGRLIDRSILMRIADYNLLIGESDDRSKLISWIEKYIIMEDIIVEDASNDYSLFEIYGTQSHSFMTMLCGKKIDELNSGNIILGDTDSIKTYIAKVKENNFIDKFLIMVNSEDTISFVKYLYENRSAFDLKFIGDRSYNFFRIINGIPTAPNEINAKYNPHEINLIHEVSFKKGCYIGQEVIARLDTYDKVQKELKGVLFETDKMIELPTTIFSSDETEVGEVTSIEQGLDKKIIGLALVRKKYMDPSNDIFMKINDEKVGIILSDFPVEE